MALELWLCVYEWLIEGIPGPQASGAPRTSVLLQGPHLALPAGIHGQGRKSRLLARALGWYSLS